MVSPRHHSHAATLDGTADLTALTFPDWVLKTASQAAAIPMAPTSARAISCAVKEASEKPRSSQTFFGTKKKMVGWVFWTSFFWSCLPKTFGIVHLPENLFFWGIYVVVISCKFLKKLSGLTWISNQIWIKVIIRPPHRRIGQNFPALCNRRSHNEFTNH